MLSVSRADALWELARLHMPAQAARFEEYTRWIGTSLQEQSLREAYEQLPAADFSRDLVAACGGLRVAAMEGAGWSDCGTPERLAALIGAPTSRAPTATAGA
jgi:hypothetical protein